MGKIKRLSKRGISFILSLITIISLIIPMSLIVNADTDGSTQMSSDPVAAKGYAGDMFKTYMSGGQGSLRMQDISEDEFRVFGVLVSNFVIPLYTNMTDLNEHNSYNASYLNGQKVDDFCVWDNFCKVWMKSGNLDDTSLMSTLKSRYEACFETKNMKKLKIGLSGNFGVDARPEHILAGRNICSLYDKSTDSDYDSLYWDDKGVSHVVFSFKEEAYGRAIVSFIRQVDIDRADELRTDSSLNLYVSAFGDICTVEKGKTIVIIPACLNPYAFAYNLGANGMVQNKFYINNLFMLSNFLCSDDLNNNSALITGVDGNDKKINTASKGTYNHPFNNEGEITQEAWTLVDGNFDHCLGSYFTTNLHKGSGNGTEFSLSQAMKRSYDSMVPYLTVVKNNGNLKAAAGLALNTAVYKDENGDDKTPASVYLAAVQPLWSVAIPASYNSTCVALVSRSSLLDHNDNANDCNVSYLYGNTSENNAFGTYSSSKVLQNATGVFGIRSDRYGATPSLARIQGYNYYFKGNDQSQTDDWHSPFTNDDLVITGVEFKDTTNPFTPTDSYEVSDELKIHSINGNLLIATGLKVPGIKDNLTLDAQQQDDDKKDGSYGIKEAEKIKNWFNENCASGEIDARQDSKGKETKYLVLSMMSAYSGSNTYYYSQIAGTGIQVDKAECASGKVGAMTGLFQIRAQDVVDTLGYFNGLAGEDGEVSNINTIHLLAEGDNSVLHKVGHNAELINAENKLTTNGGSNKERNYWSVAMPEYLYMLDGAINQKDTTLMFNAEDGVNGGKNGSGVKLNFTRGLFTEIYWGYIEEIIGIKSEMVREGYTEDDLEERSFGHLPPIVGNDYKKKIFSYLDEDSNSEAVKEKQNADRDDNIKDKIHKILNIGETIGNGLKDAAKYVTNWLKAMVDSLFIGWHNHMIGVDTTAGWTGSVSNVGNATKSGTYSTAMGYMTTPTFNSLPITGWIMANFTLIYVILMIFIVVILLMMVITRARRLPQAILIFICMAFLIILPANMLNGAISISNEAAEKIFANKFQYWAVMQHAEYIVNQSTAKNAATSGLLDSLDRQSESSKVGGVTLKWMAPKKWGIAEQIQSSTSSTRGLRLFLYLAGDVLDQEDYTHYQAGDTYIYRPYLALFTEAHSLYKRLQSEKVINEDSSSNINNLYKVSQNIVNTWTKNNSKYKVLNSMGTNKLISNSLYFTSDGKVRTDKTSDGKSYASNFFRYTTYRGDSILRSAVGGTGAGKNGIMTYPLAYYDSYYHDANIITDKNNMFSNNERIYDMYLDEQLISRLFAFKVDNVYWDTNHGTIWTSDSGNYESPCGLWLSNKKNPNTRHYSGDTSKDDLDKTFYSSGVQAYFDYSESPYYYFYNVFMDMMIHTDNGGKISGSEDFLALLLSDETFKVVNQQSPAYGEFKDYLDMEGLFKFVIPLLNYGNGNAHKYFEKYGSTVDRTEFLDDSDYESSEVEETTSVEDSKVESSADSSDSSAEESSKESSTSKKTTGVQTITKDPKTKAEDSYNKHKQQLQAIYNMYCPWVDQFLAANTKSTKIKSGYGWVELNNPCDPADYQYFGRPMAFSKAEAVIRGYKDYDLSDVEAKIQKVLNDSYYDIIELINYKDLTSIVPTDSDSYAAKEGWKGNEILVSAAAMIATFHFNQEFSDNGFMSTDITLYPQSYELKNMNFDAYLRIIMGNSMGVNQVQLMRDDSSSMTVYEKFIHETSVFSALVLIIEDILAVFLIPILKILLITVVFVLALALAVSCIINKPEHMIKIFLKTYIFPLFAMIAIFVAHTLIISWFVGEGSSAGLINSHSISVTTGDPTVTLLLMIVVDLITVILMWKLLKFAAKSTAKYIQDIGNGIASLTKGTFSGLAKIVTAAAGIGTVAVGAASLAGGAVKSTVSGVTGVGKAVSHKVENSRQTKLDKERNKLLKSGGTNGTSDKTKGKTGGSFGAGSKPTNNNSQQTNSSLAADVKAIRQKLEKGFNPEGMKQESSKPAEVKEEPKKVQAASPEASKAEKKPSAGAQKAQQLYKRKLTRKESQAAAIQSAMTGDNAGLKQAQADLDKLIAEQNALVSKYGATWNRGKKKFTSKSNNAEQNRQLNEMQRKINASRATVNTLKQRAEAVKSSAGGSGKQPRKVMKVKK